ncbi:GTPase [Streptomyces thioluteus]|uniref:GTPase n=1 Tax=Streptomyces thioluteus TaxID=66431 RepID=UPI003CD06EDE
MNDQIHTGDEHGELGDAEYAEFMELAALEGFDAEDVENELAAARPRPAARPRRRRPPNVGKSTLVNRIIAAARRSSRTGRRHPDRVTYEAEWAGRRFKVVDTGGWEQDVLGIDASVAAQAEFAIEAPTRSSSSWTPPSAPPTPTRPSSSCCAGPTSRSCCAPTRWTAPPPRRRRMLWSLGLASPTRSSRPARPRTGDMLDAVLEALPRGPRPRPSAPPSRPRRIALVGRPNVGKSSLLNQVAGEERVVVNELAGTTRDPVDELIELGGRTWKFVDTAGIRRRVHLQEGADYYASLRTAAAVEKAEVTVVLIDASESISVQDQRIITMAVEGRPGTGARDQQVGHPRRGAPLLPGARDRDRARPDRLGAAGERVGADGPAHGEARSRRSRRPWPGGRPACPRPAQRLPLGELVAAHPHPIRAASSPRILFARRRAPSRRGSSSSPPASWRPVTAASSSDGCARSSASRGRRSTSRCACGRSAAARSSRRAAHARPGVRGLSPGGCRRLRGDADPHLGARARAREAGGSRAAEPREGADGSAARSRRACVRHANRAAARATARAAARATGMCPSSPTSPCAPGTASAR